MIIIVWIECVWRFVGINLSRAQRCERPNIIVVSFTRRIRMPQKFESQSDKHSNPSHFHLRLHSTRYYIISWLQSYTTWFPRLRHFISTLQDRQSMGVEVYSRHVTALASKSQNAVSSSSLNCVVIELECINFSNFSLVWLMSKVTMSSSSRREAQENWKSAWS